MYPYLRMAWVYGRARRRSRVDLTTPLPLAMRVWPQDIDVYGHLNNGRYLTLMDLGRCEVLVRTGLLDLWGSRGWLPVAGSATARFRRSLGFLQAFTLISRVLAWDEKWFYMEQRFEVGERAAAVAYMKFVVRHRGESVGTAPVLEALGQAAESPAWPASLARWVEAEEAWRAEGSR